MFPFSISSRRIDQKLTCICSFIMYRMLSLSSTFSLFNESKFSVQISLLDFGCGTIEGDGVSGSTSL